MDAPIIDMHGIVKRFPIGTGEELEVLHGIDLTVRKGEFVAIVGASGSGKSTLMNIIGALDRPTEGTYVLDGVDVGTLRDKQLSRIRCRKIGFVFQTFNLVPRTSALKNVALPMMYNGVRGAARTQRARALLDMVEMGDRAGHAPSQLSGGQKQRVAIARALANDPRILLCDEATSALDPQTTKQILALLKSLNETLGITVVLIAHQMSVVREICTRVAVMERGGIVEEGETFTVFANPKHPLTREFIGTTSGLKKIDELLESRSPAVALRPGERIVKLSYTERSVSEPLISYVTREFGILLNIIFADVDIVQGAPIGGTVAIVSGDPAGIEAATQYLVSKNVRVEVLQSA